jgi:hypothetical protein
MTRRLRRAPLILVTLAVLIQFVPVDRSNQPETAPLQAPPEVMLVLERSCFDCHSQDTLWPWYARIAPVSWLVAHDVHEGRKHLDFSSWANLPAVDRDELREEIGEEVSEGEMPPRSYTWLHRDAVLTDADLAALRRWIADSADAEAAASSGAGPGMDDD